MTPRSTDWSLGFLVALLCATGLLSLFSGAEGSAWVFAVHGIAGSALGFVVGWKLRRVWRRLFMPRRWDRRTIIGALATGAVLATLVSGWVWSSGGNLDVAGWNLLNWHIALGVALTLVVGLHALARAKPLRRRDLVPDVQRRKHVLQIVGIVGSALGAWGSQRSVAAAAGWRGAQRRWTGSYESGSWNGNAFPATSWVADRPRALQPNTYRLTVDGLVRRPLALALSDVSLTDRLTVTLDCTGGFYSTQQWRGIALQRLIDQAGALPQATHVRVESVTGYRWSFPLADARAWLLASHVGGEALAHAHGAPLRLVAPGRRGFQWIKWVVRIELHAGIDYGAAASTVWSSWTPAGRGE